MKRLEKKRWIKKICLVVLIIANVIAISLTVVSVYRSAAKVIREQEMESGERRNGSLQQFPEEEGEEMDFLTIFEK